MSAVGAYDKGRRISHRKCLRSDEDPVIGRTLLRQIDDGRRARGAGRDGDRQRGRAGRASSWLRSAGFGTVDIVDDGEIGRLRALRHLHAHRRGCRIVGETDVKVGMPGNGSDLDRGVADGDAGMRARRPSAAREHRNHGQGNNRSQNLQTQHDTPLARPRPATRRAYGWQSVNKTRYRRVDVPFRGTADRARRGCKMVIHRRPSSPRERRIQCAAASRSCHPRSGILIIHFRGW
jgi:hypothetical protein